MLRYKETINLADDISPDILSLITWEPEDYMLTIFDYPITHGEHERLVKECEADIIFGQLEAMFGITPETIDINELEELSFFKNLPENARYYYLDIIFNVIDKYNVVENTVALYESYVDDTSFDYDYDMDPVPDENDIYFESSDDEDD
jgi:hypothetical protein